MAYIKTTWQTGDVITAEKLNNAENGIAGAYPYVIDQTWTVNGGSYETTLAFSDFIAQIRNGRYTVVHFPAIPDILDEVYIPLLSFMESSFSESYANFFVGALSESYEVLLSSGATGFTFTITDKLQLPIGNEIV